MGRHLIFVVYMLMFLLYKLFYLEVVKELGESLYFEQSKLGHNLIITC